MTPWEILLARLVAARSWPIPSEVKVRQQIMLWAALRESDEGVLRRIMRWPLDRDLVIDNLPEKIASAFGDLLFGETPTFTAGDEADQPLLDDAIESWPSDLQAAEETCVSEGEVWYRITSDPLLPHPSVTWHTRADVVPLLRGREPLAVAFVSRLPSPAPQSREVWRHIEIHQVGMVANVLFRGREHALGQREPLTRHTETELLPPLWNHGLDVMLAGRIVNRWGRRPLAGVSIYTGVWSQFLVLNEATTIGRENLRLTAKKRAVVPASALRTTRPGAMPTETIDRGDGTRVPVRSAPVWDAGEDLLVHDPLDVEEGREGAGPFRILEYSFDAQALITYKKDLTETICQRCDIVPQFIGSGDFGRAQSGTALRVRLLPTVNAAEARGRHWDDELPVVAQKVQLLEAAPIGAGGLGRDAWTNPAAPPAVERDVPFPEDPDDIATRQSTLKTADLLSIETALRERYPDRDDQWITDEVARIRTDVASTMPAAPTFGA